VELFLTHMALKQREALWFSADAKMVVLFRLEVLVRTVSTVNISFEFNIL
jgi:hypothetical protein